MCDRPGDHAIAALSPIGLPHGVGRINNYCQVVTGCVVQERGDPVFLAQEHARVGVVIEPFPIQENIGSVVYAPQFQPGLLPLLQWRYLEAVAKPERVERGAHVMDIGYFLVIHPVKHVWD
ncbi:hypothetical protein SDC9_208688 [bioreactor metagenome]|uniref:Uncharacterized protein n=1 Tax=bioreactor metagenome TaxID=1076179 RepID=A0A645JB84_9ZZZZ